jgi:ribosomal-protein-alanine N-acetyltransferase
MDRVASLMYIFPVTKIPAGRCLYSSERVELRRLAYEDREELTRLARASEDLYHPWIHAPTTYKEFDSYLARFNRETAEGFLISIRNTGTLAGFINISEIIRGPYERGTLGYGAFAPSAGKGYMTEGFRLLFRFAFEDLRLHRLEADIQPGNAASLKLVQKLGFRLEGFSPKFIYIRGEWRDHERWAITTEMPGARSWLVA